jgi:hypothetical protein
MAHLIKLRRGWKDDVTNRDDWADHETVGGLCPQEGELVVEYDNGIPRLKIGDGETPFSALPYISIDSFILSKSVPKTITIELPASAWIATIGDDGIVIENSWCQTVLQGNTDITPNSKVDLQPNTSQLTLFHEKDLAFVAENEDGIVTVFCVGQKPRNDYEIQATITEVVANG